MTEATGYDHDATSLYVEKLDEIGLMLRAIPLDESVRHRWELALDRAIECLQWREEQILARAISDEMAGE